MMLSHYQSPILPQILEDDEETYTTDSPEEEEVGLVEFGAVEFWNNEVSNELSEIISSNVTLEE